MNSVEKAGAPRLSPTRLLLFGLFLFGIVYVGNMWSPSSYGLVLQMFQAKETGVVAGEPRAIRMDEYFTLTPFIQATVNNGLRRYNETSFYGEDLRMFFSLPVKDWGLIFKPNLWLYPFTDPAYAYSFQYYALIVLFLVGYTWWFRNLGASEIDAVLLSTILFFTGYSQYWWTVLGPTLAVFPWLIVTLQSRLPWAVRLLLFYWIAACWLLGIFYPPLIIATAFVALITVIAVTPELFQPRRLLPLAGATLAALGTVGLYLKDYIVANWNTYYPGARRVGGGGEGLNEWLLQFLPTSQIVNHESLIAGQNICEIGVVGSYYLLFALCFLDYGQASREQFRAGRYRPLLVMSTGLAMVYAWLYLPVPEWAGRLLLWCHVPPHRMVFAAGLLLLMSLVVAVRIFGLKLTWTRFAAFAAFTISGAYYLKYRAIAPQGHGQEVWLDLIVLVPLAVIVALAKRLDTRRLHTAMLAAAAGMNLLAFGGFNPLQSAQPIFHREATPVSAALDRTAEASGGILALDKRLFAALNGWGYRSVNHILVAPQMELWAEIFPDLPPRMRDLLFNRYEQVALSDAIDTPRLTHIDGVLVPRGRILEWYKKKIAAARPPAAGGGDPRNPLAP